MNAIETDNLCINYGSFQAVRDVSVNVVEGGVFGLLGPNGAGKSTFVRACLGLIRPESGTMRTLGLDPMMDGVRVRRQVGFVLEHVGLYEGLSCKANLELYGRIYRVPAATLKRRISSLLERFGLSDRERQPAGTLSRGLKQRLALVRSLLHEPRLIILDEPTFGLDPAAARDVRAVVAELARDEGRTVVLTTHNMIEAERLCTTVAIMRGGEIAGMLDARRLAAVAGLRVRCPGLDGERVEAIASAVGAIEAYQKNEIAEFVFDPGSHADEVRRAVEAAGATVSEVVRPALGLEELYLDVTGVGPGD